MRGLTVINTVLPLDSASPVSGLCSLARTIVAADMRDTSPVRSELPRSATVAHNAMHGQTLIFHVALSDCRKETWPVSITPLLVFLLVVCDGESV